MSTAIKQHVLPNLNGGWSVVRGGSTRASRIFSSQSDAVRYARDKAKAEGALLFIHRSDGTILEMDSYDREPVQARAKR